MKGLYLYGIYPFLAKRKRLSIKGIDGAGKINFLRCKDIEAVFSEVKLEEFSSEEIRRKAIEDLEWIKNKAVAHEKVIEAVMMGFNVSIIPMKFGTIFKTRENLPTSLRKNYTKFKELLEKLRNKEEWALKVYADAAILASAIKNSSPIFQKKTKEANSLPSGKDYFLEKDIEETAFSEAKKTLSNYPALFLKALEPLAEEVKENKVLDKILTQKNEPMIFNGAFLIKKEKNRKFLQKTQKLDGQFKEKGLTLEVSGPWPPYNFV